MSTALDGEDKDIIHGCGDEYDEKEKGGLARGVSRAHIREAVKGYLQKKKKQQLKEADILDGDGDGDHISTDVNGRDQARSAAYPEVRGLPDAYRTFRLGHGGLPAEAREEALSAARHHHAKYQATLLGYQCNQNLSFQRDFGWYLNIHTNNIGDPFKEGTYTLNSKFMERAVLDYYAELWNAKYPHFDNDPESYWGFCLTMGSTEGNMYAMWNARDYLSGKKILIDGTSNTDHDNPNEITYMPRLMYHTAHKPHDKPNAHTPIAFFSEDTHYSFSKTMTMLDIRTFYAEGMEHYVGMCPLVGSNGKWPVEVPSLESGAMDLDALTLLVEFFASKGYPIIVCFNYGTTFKGAYDDVEDACNKLQPILQKHNLLERQVHYDEHDESKMDVRNGYWFHVDGALGASYMPYIEMAFNGGLVEQQGPTFDFRLPMVHSISTSGHKWIGAPYACGVFMTRTKFQMVPPDTPDVIGTPDTTFAGSRNALSPMFLWDYIARTSYEDQVFKAIRLEHLASYAESRLCYLQDEVLKEDLYVQRTPLTLTIQFKRANNDLCLKYTLSNEDLHDRRYSHIFIMEHVTHQLIDALIEDLSKPGAFIEDATHPITLVTTNVPQLAPIKTRKLAHVPSRGRGFR